jgi:hypothetical protein
MLSEPQITADNTDFTEKFPVNKFTSFSYLRHNPHLRNLRFRQFSAPSSSALYFGKPSLRARCLIFSYLRYHLYLRNLRFRQFSAQKASTQKICDCAIHQGMLTLKQAGAELVREGKSTVEEVKAAVG